MVQNAQQNTHTTKQNLASAQNCKGKTLFSSESAIRRADNPSITVKIPSRTGHGMDNCITKPAGLGSSSGDVSPHIRKLQSESMMMRPFRWFRTSHQIQLFFVTQSDKWGWWICCFIYIFKQQIIFINRFDCRGWIPVSKRTFKTSILGCCWILTDWVCLLRGGWQNHSNESGIRIRSRKNHQAVKQWFTMTCVYELNINNEDQNS